jgi:hypothetical protein
VCGGIEHIQAMRQFQSVEEISLGEASEHFLSAHQNAFEFLGLDEIKQFCEEQGIPNDAKARSNLAIRKAEQNAR